MPLQKLPAQGSNNSQAVKRRQLQERRRTLQTISELSASDGAQPDFNVFMRSKPKGQYEELYHTGLEKQTPNLSKRRSLPRYCSSPECLRAQAFTNETLLHGSRSQQLRPTQVLRTTKSSMHEQGWNARRERARMESEYAVGGPNNERAAYDPKAQFGNNPLNAGIHTLPSQQPNRSHARLHDSQQQLLRNSRSFTGVQEQHTSYTGISAPIERGEYDTESSGRASTDSSSHRSSHDRAIRRSRSGSSSETSYSSLATPPMPVLPPPRMQRYYSMPSSYLQYHPVVSGPATWMYTGPAATDRTSSLPSIRVEYVGSSPLEQKHTYIAQQKQQLDVQRARLESLAALTAAREGVASPNQRPSPPIDHRNSLPSQRNRYSSNQGRPRSDSHLKPPPQHTPYHRQRVRSNSKTAHNQNLDRHGGHAEGASLENRPVPKRESLTQWKTEREEAKAEFEGLQRAKMRDRVRRANEMELQREKELAEMGKGMTAVDEKENGEDKGMKEAGCFGGLLDLFKRKRRGNC
jgi:hypothetical protein